MNSRHQIYAVLILFFSTAASAQNATEIMKRNEELMRVGSVTAKVTLTVGTGKKAEKVKIFDSWRKLRDDKVHYNTLTRFSHPPEIKDEAVMMQEFPDNQNNVFIYLPKFRKTRRVEGYDQGKSFMGTVFSYSDVATFHYTNYTYKLLKNEPCPASRDSCYVIEAKPRNDEVRKRTRYSKVMNWVSTKTGLIAKSECYDLDGKKEKAITASKYQETDSGKFVALFVKAERFEDGKFSTLAYKNPKFDIEIDDSLFSEERLSSIP